MKSFILMMSCYCLVHQNTPPKDIMVVSDLVYAFAQSADARDVDRIDTILHKEFRAIVNQAFNSTELQVIDKGTYLDLMRKEVLGGDERTVTILSIDMEDNNAIIKAKFTGKALIFTTFIQAVKDATGTWHIISDMPVIQKIE